ncbi:MAG: hypothetical protein WBM98_05980, partial [Maribacter sp.]|uniref:hypothetical protein n=1 Tax=Maribacter sp. TaxID=1897614 RepID=UPI003C789BA3
MGLRICTLFVLWVLIGPLYVFSQNDFSTEVIEPLTKDALYKEKVFIHLNKSVYFANENIWFAAYVVEDDNTPAGLTTNLLVNLLESKGDVIASKNVFVNKGMGQGDFFIDNTIPSGTYFIQGFTSFMQNFGPQNVFLQEIEIINPSNIIAHTKRGPTSGITVAFFPESGHLLEGVQNTIGIKVTGLEKDDPFHGKIVDSNGNDITTFEGNLFGMGTCRFFYEKNESYRAILSIDTIQKYSLPKADKTGLVFSLDNAAMEKIKLTLRTNAETLPSLNGKKFTLLFYRNNTLYEAVHLSLENAQETSQELFIDKTKMLPGVNRVTLFQENQPIAVRKFYVDKQNEDTAVLIDRVNIENDSLLFKIKTIGPDYKPVSAQLSISILPEETKAFREQQHIKSGFLLSPYVKGAIETPAFYFRNREENEKEYLDVVLLNQGMEHSTLNEMIKEVNPREKFSFEHGFTLGGTVKNKTKGYDLGMLSRENEWVAFSGINEKKEFSFENVFAYK